MATQINMEAFRNGDEKEFEKVYSICSKQLTIYVNYIIKNRPDAEDIAADAFAKLPERRMNFESLAAIKGFLYRTAYNQSMNYLKHNKVVSTYEKETRHINPDNEDPDVLRKMVKAEIFKELYEALPMLPSKCRKICELRYFERMSKIDISKKLNISVGNVGTQLTIALEKLSRLIKKQTFF